MNQSIELIGGEGQKTKMACEKNVEKYEFIRGSQRDANKKPMRMQFKQMLELVQEEWGGGATSGMSNSTTTAISGGGGARTRNAKKKAKRKVQKSELEEYPIWMRVMDDKTRLILLRMSSSGVLQRRNGLITIGREANVFHGVKSDGQELAIKIYRTYTDVYKDKDRRVQDGYGRHNSREAAILLAEKEMTNLLRLMAAGIRCPTPHVQQSNVLVMDFIGISRLPARRLMDAPLSIDKLRDCYMEMVVTMRNMYQKCKLVHGDLTEYNILYFEDNLYIIDVPQSVDHDHEEADNLLTEDCRHINVFFKKNRVSVMDDKELFDFIKDVTIADEDVDAYLDEVRKSIEGGEERSAENEKADDATLMQELSSMKI